MSRFAAFVRLSRPLFLVGGIVGVALGAAVARANGAHVGVETYLWAQALVSAFHLMVHYANEYFDREADAYGAPSAWSGGSGVLVAGDVHPRVALIAALLCAALGLVVTARFALTGNAPVAWLGIAILVFAWCYSAPPVRFAARGLGEFDAALVVAVLVPFAGYAAFTGHVDRAILDAVAAPAFAMLAMMLAVEFPDAAGDRLAGKRNLVVRAGLARARQLIAISTAFALATALATALKLHASVAMLALAPQVVAAVALGRLVPSDRRAGAVAFWGVTLYATTVAGLAAVYALVAAR